MRNSYSEKLRHPKWQRRRLEIMNRDGFRCQKCKSDDKTLNVHHLYYTGWNDPWDYPDDALATLCEICHQSEHSKPTGLNIYLAGKISKNCWRHGIVKGPMAGLGSCGDSLPFENPPEIVPSSIFGLHHFTGPFFIGCDHGCFHGRQTHGAIPNKGFQLGAAELSSPQIKAWARCMKGIRLCDLFFAWIDSDDCHGTLAEIGYAAGIGKFVSVFFDASKNTNALWFAKQFATIHAFAAGDPESALDLAIHNYQEMQKL